MIKLLKDFALNTLKKTTPEQVAISTVGSLAAAGFLAGGEYAIQHGPGMVVSGGKALVYSGIWFADKSSLGALNM